MQLSRHCHSCCSESSKETVEIVSEDVAFGVGKEYIFCVQLKRHTGRGNLILLPLPLPTPNLYIGKVTPGYVMPGWTLASAALGAGFVAKTAAPLVGVLGAAAGAGYGQASAIRESLRYLRKRKFRPSLNDLKGDKRVKLESTVATDTSGTSRATSMFKRRRRRTFKRRFRRGLRRFRRRGGIVKRAVRGALRAQLRRIETMQTSFLGNNQNLRPGDGTAYSTYLYNPLPQIFFQPPPAGGRSVFIGTKIRLVGIRFKALAVNPVAADTLFQIFLFTSARRAAYAAATLQEYTSTTTETANPAPTPPQQNIIMYNQFGAAIGTAFAPTNATAPFDTNEIKVIRMKSLNFYNAGVAGDAAIAKVDFYVPINKFVRVEDPNETISGDAAHGFFKWRQYYLGMRVYSGSTQASVTTSLNFVNWAYTVFWKNDQ